MSNPFQIISNAPTMPSAFHRLQVECAEDFPDRHFEVMELSLDNAVECLSQFDLEATPLFVTKRFKTFVRLLGSEPVSGRVRVFRVHQLDRPLGYIGYLKYEDSEAFYYFKPGLHPITQD